MYPLYVTKFKCKNGNTIPVLKSYDKVVTFDTAIILAITSLSYPELLNSSGDIIIMERS